MNLETLPDFLDCKKAVDAGTATPLQTMIYNHEPADNQGADEFRFDLAAAIEAAFPADLKSELRNKLFGIYDPKGPAPAELIARIDAL